MKLKLYIITGIMLFFAAPVFPQGNCLDFDGVDDYVNITDHSNINFGTNSFTIEFWIRTSTKSTALLSKINNTHTTGWYLFLDGNGKINCTINGSTGTPTNAKDLSDNTWHHIAVVRKNIGGSFEYLLFYQDGVQIGSSLLFTGGSVSNSDDMVFGDAPASTNYDGLLEEVRIWITERSESHIRSNMYTEISPYATGLVAYYRFSESSGVITDNLEGNAALDGTLLNMTSSVWVASTVPMPFQTQSGASNWSATSSWKNGTIPNSSWAPIYIFHNILVDDNYEAAKVNVYGATVTIKPTGSLTLSGNFINSGTLIVKSNSSGDIGSFIDNGTTTGTMKLERYISENKWHYISIPITSASSGLFRGAALYSYDEPTAIWTPIIGGQTLTRMTGYDVYFPNTGDKNITFDGTFSTGTVSLGLTYNSLGGQGFNLVGNPYPSAIDWDAPSGWSRTNINSAVYLWNHSTLKVEIYVQGGGTGTDGGSRYIPPTQGFYVICTAATTLGMTNSVRATTNRELRSEYNSNELRFKITGASSTNEALIRFNPESTEEFDGAYDAYKFFSLIPSHPQIYTENESLIKFSINAIPSSNMTKSIPLHAQIGEDGLYTIDCDLSHYDEQAEVYLEDLFTGIVKNLKIEAKYDFSAKKADHTNRFLIHLLPYGEIYKQQTGLDEDATDEEYLIYSNEKDIYIRTGLNAEIHDIVLFDLFGKEVYRSEVSNTHLIKMSPNLASGVYIIRINTGKRIISQKLNLL